MRLYVMRRQRLRRVIGDAGDEEDVGGYVWNYVLLDNKWYLQDTTWDGQNYSAKDKKRGSNREWLLIPQNSSINRQKRKLMIK